jgi:2-hydroxychromene-2-carboxylate isomerase
MEWAMKFGKLILSALAGGSLAMGGGMMLRARGKRLAEARKTRDLLVRVVNLALRTLSEMRGGGRVSASEAYYFIWVTERVAARHGLDLPGFKFGVVDGALDSQRLTMILRKMLADREINILENHLEPVWDAQMPVLEPKQAAILEKIGMIIDEVAAQWDDDAADEQLVRFGKLFK